MSLVSTWPLSLSRVCFLSSCCSINSEADVCAAVLQSAAKNSFAVLSDDGGLVRALLGWLLDVHSDRFTGDDATLRFVEFHVEGKHELAVGTGAGSLISNLLKYERGVFRTESLPWAFNGEPIDDGLIVGNLPASPFQSAQAPVRLLPVAQDPEA